METKLNYRIYLFDLKRSMLIEQMAYMRVTLLVGIFLIMFPISTLNRLNYKQYSMEVALSPIVYLRWILIATTVITFVECLIGGLALHN